MRPSVALILAALVCLLAACSDSPTETDEGLSEDARADLVRALALPVLRAVFETALRGGPAAPTLAAADRSLPVDQTTPCPVGGTNRVTGSLAGEDPQPGAVTLAADLDDVLADCGLLLEGKTYTLNTVPRLDVTGSVLLQNEVLQEAQTLSMSGTVSVRPARGPAFSCPVDLALAVTVSDRNADVTGTACDAPVDVSLTWPGL